MTRPNVSPYEGLESRAYWRSGVLENHPLRMSGVFRPKFPLSHDDVVATAGSCFAQHIARALRARGYNVLDAEPAPEELAPEVAIKFGYSMYSARYGNIYTTRQMLQLLLEAEGRFQPADCIWTNDGRYYDAMRPNVEPDGLESPEECKALRQTHLQAVRRICSNASVFVFTLGLTEAWIHKESGTVYPTAPGTIAGSFDPALHAFKNFTYEEVLADLRQMRALLKRRQPDLKMLLTVSPVPLTATASGDHVLSATTYSKAVLRAAAGAFANDHSDVDYFPSFEIISGIQARGFFYESNLRSVSSEGVGIVMNTFFAAHNDGGQLADPSSVGAEHGKEPATHSADGGNVKRSPADADIRERRRRKRERMAAESTADLAERKRRRMERAKRSAEGSSEDVVCEDALLEAFAKQ